jgi:hypothetical protein
MAIYSFNPRYLNVSDPQWGYKVKTKSYGEQWNDKQLAWTFRDDTVPFSGRQKGYMEDIVYKNKPLWTLVLIKRNNCGLDGEEDLGVFEIQNSEINNHNPKRLLQNRV